jgi:ketosteroid isomerase-like protein
VNPKDIADRYFAAIRARNVDDLIALYAEDATFVLPNGKESKGIAAIRATHQYVFDSGAPMPVPQAMIIGDGAVAVEIEARMPDGTSRRTANFYHLNSQGRIQRLSVYMRSG